MSSLLKVLKVFTDLNSGDDALAQATRDSAYGSAPLPSLEPSPAESSDNGQAPVQNSRKRAREDDGGDDGDDNDRSFADGGEDGDDNDGGVGSPVAKKVAYVFAGQVTIPPLCAPKSQYSGHKYSMPIEKEFQVISTLLVGLASEMIGDWQDAMNDVGFSY